MDNIKLEMRRAEIYVREHVMHTLLPVALV